MSSVTLKPRSSVAVVQRADHSRGSLTELLIKKLYQVEHNFGSNPQKKITAERILDALIREALGGDMKAISHIFDRVDGKTIQPVSIPGMEAEDVEFTVQIGRRGADGSEEIATLHAKKAVDVPEAE